MDDIGGLYAEGRRRLSDIAAGLDAERVDGEVPACPKWTVRNVVAHLAGCCADVLAGNLDGVTTEPWADAQVRRRADRTMAELLEEWTAVAPRVEALADGLPSPLGTLWVLDLTAHEQDVRGAVGQPGSRTAPALVGATEFLLDVGLHTTLVARELGPLRIRSPERSWTVGTGTTSPAELRCSVFDLFRALTGRRSRRQIAAFDWSTDPAPFVPAFEFGTFTTRSTDLVE